ncbi:glycosyltransferase [Harryflintia acetispora]|nr:glycosyltransferase [Harryflintia acetispora]
MLSSTYLIKGIRLLFTKGPVVLYRRVMLHGQRYLANWKLKRYLQIDDRELEIQRNYRFRQSPVISILTPLYNTPECFLRDMINSVIGQTYPYWELCLADGSDVENSYVEEVCREYANLDSRIQYKKLKENRGISENTNECIRISSGEFLGLLDHDDILHPSALFEVVLSINKYNADFIFTDEVKFSHNINDPYDPAFKPDFSEEELRALNYICHFTAFKRQLIDQAGAFNSTYDGSQDHDLVLRLTEKAECIIHIPKVLYYWRVHKESVAFSIEAKHYAIKAAQEAILSQLKRCNEKGKIESTELFPTVYRIKYELAEKSLVSIIISGGSLAQTRQCKLLLKKALSYQPYEIICSENPLTVSNEEIRKQTNGKYILLLDTSLISIGEDCIQELLMLLQKPKIKLVGGMPINHKQKLLYAGITYTHNMNEPLCYWHEGLSTDLIRYKMELHHVRSTTALWEGFMMFKADDWRRTGGFSGLTSDFLGPDLCLRLKGDGEILWTPYAKAVFKINRIRKNQDFTDRFFYDHWGQLCKQNDPHCNPNLKKFNFI